MDIEEIIYRLTDANEDTVGKFINQLADSYRLGADLRTLIPLLKHPDSRLVSVATWIASEVVDGNRGREIFDELAALLDHPDSAVRFGVIESIALLVKPEERPVLQRLFLLAIDPNIGVRQQTLYWLCRIPASLIEPLQDTELWSSVRLLISNASKDAIRAAITAEKLFEQRIAVAAALRNYGSDDTFMSEILPYFDAEVVASLPRLRLG